MHGETIYVNKRKIIQERGGGSRDGWVRRGKWGRLGGGETKEKIARMGRGGGERKKKQQLR